MVDQARIQDCQRRIAEGWLSLLPAGDWTVSYLFWGPAGRAVYSETTAIDKRGQLHSLQQPPSVHEAITELRDLMSDPQRGAWISAQFKFTDDGVLEADYNWDKRFYWGMHPGNPWAPDPDPSAPVVPSDDDYLDELERYPREAVFVPTWYPRARVLAGQRLDDDALDPRRADPGYLDPFEQQRAARVTLPDEVKPLQDAWGWPGIFSTINESVLANMDRRAGDDAAALLGHRTEHERDLALESLANDAVLSTMLVIDRSPALVAVRLLREWLAIRDEREPAGLAEANLGEPLSGVLQRPDAVGESARTARTRLESLVRLVVEDNIDDRFDA